jgi:hypothetical protein
MGDIDYWFEQYEKEVEGFDTLIEKLQSLGDASSKPKVFTKTVTECDAKAARIKDIKKSMGLELRLVKDKQERSEYDAAIKEIDERVTILNKDLKLAKSQSDKNDLFQDKKGMRSQFSSEGKNNEELLEGANQIQDLTFDSLARTRGLIEASKEVGAATIDELRRQRDQIKDIEAEVDIIDSNLKRAERLLFNFSRRMATDRIIQAFTAINIGVMLALILYISITGKSLTISTASSTSSGPSASNQPSSQPTRFPPGATRSPTIVKPPTAKPSFPGKPTFRPTKPPLSFAPSASIVRRREDENEIPRPT